MAERAALAQLLAWGLRPPVGGFRWCLRSCVVLRSNISHTSTASCILRDFGFREKCAGEHKLVTAFEDKLGAPATCIILLWLDLGILVHRQLILRIAAVVAVICRAVADVEAAGV